MLSILPYPGMKDDLKNPNYLTLITFDKQNDKNSNVLRIELPNEALINTTLTETNTFIEVSRVVYDIKLSDIVVKQINSSNDTPVIPRQTFIDMIDSGNYRIAVYSHIGDRDDGWGDYKTGRPQDFTLNSDHTECRIVIRS